MPLVAYVEIVYRTAAGPHPGQIGLTIRIATVVWRYTLLFSRFCGVSECTRHSIEFGAKYLEHCHRSTQITGRRYGSPRAFMGAKNVKHGQRYLGSLAPNTTVQAHSQLGLVVGAYLNS